MAPVQNSFAVCLCHSLPSIVCPGREVPSKSLAVFFDPVSTCQLQYLLRKFEAASQILRISQIWDRSHIPSLTTEELQPQGKLYN